MYSCEIILSVIFSSYIKHNIKQWIKLWCSPFCQKIDTSFQLINMSIKDWTLPTSLKGTVHEFFKTLYSRCHHHCNQVVILHQNTYIDMHLFWRAILHETYIFSVRSTQRNLYYEVMNNLWTVLNIQGKLKRKKIQRLELLRTSKPHTAKLASKNKITLHPCPNQLCN